MVAVVITVVAINSLIYVGLVHLLYSLLLASMGISPGKLPAFAERLIFPRGRPPAPIGAAAAP